MQRSNATETMVSFLVGGLLGAGVALLFAPRPGRELRGLIGDGSRRLKDRAAVKGRELVDDARQGLEWQKDRLAAAIEAGRDAYRQEKALGAQPGDDQVIGS